MEECFLINHHALQGNLYKEPVPMHGQNGEFSHLIPGKICFWSKSFAIFDHIPGKFSINNFQPGLYSILTSV